MVDFEYDDKGLKTAIIIDGEKLPIFEELNSDSVFIVGKDAKYLFNRDYELIAYQKGDNYYYGDGTILAESRSYEKGIKHLTVLFKDGTKKTWKCKGLKCSFSAQGLHIKVLYHHTDDNWWDDALIGIEMLPNGTVRQIGPNINGDLSWFTIKEIDKDGTYVIRNKDNVVHEFGNKEKGLVWSGWGKDGECVWNDKKNYLTKKTDHDNNEFYIIKRDGLNIEGYEIIHHPVNPCTPITLEGFEPDEFFDFYNIDYMPGYEIKEGTKVLFTCDQDGNITRRDNAGYHSKCNLRNDDVCKYDPNGNLFFKQSGDWQEFYTKSQSGKMLLKYRGKIKGLNRPQVYVYKDDMLCKIITVDHRIVAQRDFCDNQGRIIQSIEYKICKVPYPGVKDAYIDKQCGIDKIINYNPETGNIDTKFVYKDDNKVSETHYTYYEDSSKIETVTKKENDSTIFEHYTIDGKEDTIDYLANERVKARKQEITAKNGSRPKVIRDVAQKIIATNLFNRLAKRKALRAVKKSR